MVERVVYNTRDSIELIGFEGSLGSYLFQDLFFALFYWVFLTQGVIKRLGSSDLPVSYNLYALVIQKNP